MVYTNYFSYGIELSKKYDKNGKINLAELKM